MKVALVGTGYQADVYMSTFSLHPDLEIVGCWDIDGDRLITFTEFHGLRAYGSYAELLSDPSVAMVVNITNPRSHWEVSSQALDAGKHVYSEKPLAMNIDDARDLVARAERNGVTIAGAPCNQLGEHTENLRQALADRGPELGRPLVIYAEMDDGMIPGLQPERWHSSSGAPWPVRDEYEVGCTLEHAGYQVGPLVEIFGPVRAVTAFNACLLPEKVIPYGGTVIAPDFSTGVLEFDNGVIARLTCSILAPVDRSLRVVCEHGVLTLDDVWEFNTTLRYSPTGLGKVARLTRRVERTLAHRLFPGAFVGRRLRNRALDKARKATGLPGLGLIHEMDFARGIAQLVAQLEGRAPVRLSPELTLHVTEVALALTAASASSGRVEISSADTLRKLL